MAGCVVWQVLSFGRFALQLFEIGIEAVEDLQADLAAGLDRAARVESKLLVG